MAKVASKYLEVNPYKIIEKGFHQDRYQVSESIFSLQNEYMGVRDFFEEGVSLTGLIGTYVNGIFDFAKEDIPNAYKGIVKRTHFTLNCANFFKIKIRVGEEILDLAKVKYSDFYRELDMKSGLLTRSFVWNASDANISIKIERLLDMVRCENAYQRIIFKSDKDINLDLSLNLDNNIKHWNNSQYFWKNTILNQDGNLTTLVTNTQGTNQSLAVATVVDIDDKPQTLLNDNELISTYSLKIKANAEKVITRYISLFSDQTSNGNVSNLLEKATKAAKESKTYGFEYALNSNIAYFKDVYQRSDIEIEGNDEDQQGIRYCVFQLEQTYHGYSEDNNIGAKGLTGEAYSGHAFWDSETYCLPYFLLTNQKAAMNMLMFRYNTLSEAISRAKDLDCEGACFPIATRNGMEACSLWQHASTQIQPTTAVAYAIFHYMNIYHDDEFMEKYGLEMLLQICKFLLSRGAYTNNEKEFGFYGVMGPDEFQLMVNNNTYTNFMAKKAMDYTISLIESGKYNSENLLKKCGYDNEKFLRLKDASSKMIILYDEKTKLYEQHDGFFKLPHVDIHSIPVEEFPLYAHWTYDRIYRNDIIKQPDVLMFMFLYPNDFDKETKRVNYEYYESRCIHESSLSPSVHSIIASSLGKEKEALDFFSFATRLDLDDYNRNTSEGLHATSIAAAWLNIVYGFLGLTSDGKILTIKPSLPSRWKSYKVSIFYEGIYCGRIIENV